MKFNMSKCLESFSLALDFVVMNVLQVSLNHSRRVAYIALNLGNSLGLTGEDIKELYAFSLLHDNGLSIAGLRKSMGEQDIDEFVINRIEDGLTKSELNLAELELIPEHCTEGERNMAKLPMFKRKKNVIKYHHENYDGSGIFGIVGEDIPFFSQIIRLADSLDVSFNLKTLKPEKRPDLIQFVKDHTNSYFSPRVVDAFLVIAEKERFWSDLSFYNITEVLDRIAPGINYEYSWDDIIPISETIMKIIDSASKFTFLHSTGITEKIETMSDYYDFDDEKRKKLHIAANLHDLGKLYVPNSILEKPGKLTDIEFFIIKKHPYFTKLALDKIPGFEDISRWAASHHEKLNGKGYPECLPSKEIDFESRLMVIVDIYQALTEERPYRKSLSHEEAMKIIYDMVEKGQVDGEIARDVDEVIGGGAHEESVEYGYGI